MLRFIAITALILALYGCTTTTQQSHLPVTDESHELWAQRQQLLSGMNDWEIRGRVALFVNDKVYNLGLSWVLAKQHFSMKLEAALGQGMIALNKNGQEVSLTTSKGEKFIGSNAEQVLRQSTGWSLPVEGLQSWIKGINHQHSDYLPDIDHVGRARSLSQDNWLINYFDYKRPVNSDISLDLPRKIYMKRQNLALKIVIDQWQTQQNTIESDIFPTFED